MLDPTLLQILVCPIDRGPLLLVEPVLSGPALYNARLRKAYRIEDGIPVLLIDEAIDIGPEEHQRLIARSAGGDNLDSGTTA